MRAYRPWCTVTVGLILFARSLWAATPHVANGYFLNGHEVWSPLASDNFVGPVGLFITATRCSLVSALEGAGWRLVPEVAAPHAESMSQEAALVFVRQVGDAPGAAVASDNVLVWPVANNIDGPGKVWFARLVHPQQAQSLGNSTVSQPAAARADADLLLKAVFLTGTSRLSVAVPTGSGRKPLAWVRLRHASGELQLSTEIAGQEVDTPPAPEATQLAECLPGDAPDKTSYQPNPEAGPACEMHGALPLHPLAAQQIANSVVWHSAVTGKLLALTFDACSTFAIGRFNPRVVATLRAEKVPATLFVGGHWAEMYPDVLEELAQDPLFEIGNHTYSHPHMRDLSPEDQRQELLWTQELIFQHTGKVPKLLRPPYGEVDDTLITTAGKSGLYTVEYDLPAGDADDHVTKMRLSNWVVGHSSPGSIVVMHMCRPNNHTAEALPQIVRSLREQGYKFCQVSDMLFNGGKQCQ